MFVANVVDVPVAGGKQTTLLTGGATAGRVTLAYYDGEAEPETRMKCP